MKAALHEGYAFQFFGHKAEFLQLSCDGIVGKHSEHKAGHPGRVLLVLQRHDFPERVLADIPDAAGGKNQVQALEHLGFARGRIVKFEIRADAAVQQARTHGVGDGRRRSIQSDKIGIGAGRP